MKTANKIIDIINALISLVLVLVLILAGLYSAYALWDNSLVYAAADGVQADMMGFKPDLNEENPSLEELLAINPDVVGWVSIDNTRMDYPLVQGENNLSYINRDIYGDFSLAGSIFLDSRNDSNFQDFYSLLYGHSMASGRMFGDINLYKEEDFFLENQTGSLVTREGSYELKIFASLVVPANEAEIFNPSLWQDSIEDLFDYAEEEGLYLNNETLEEIRSLGQDVRILALTTCSYEFTDARTVILSLIVDN